MPLAHMFIHGHGGWKPQDGYTQVPKNCSVTFYTHFAKLLNATMAYPVLQNTYTGQAERVIGQYMQVPNMVLSNLTADQRQKAIDIFDSTNGRNLWMLPAAPHSAIRLSAVLQGFRDKIPSDVEISFHWMACQELGLKRVGGGQYGVNASDRSFQAGHEGQYLFKWKDKNGVEMTKWVDSESTFNRA